MNCAIMKTELEMETRHVTEDSLPISTNTISIWPQCQEPRQPVTSNAGSLDINAHIVSQPTRNA